MQSVRYSQVFKQRGSRAGLLGAGPEYDAAEGEAVPTGDESFPGEVTAATVVDTAYDLVRVVTLPLLVKVSHAVLYIVLVAYELMVPVIETSTAAVELCGYAGML